MREDWEVAFCEACAKDIEDCTCCVGCGEPVDNGLCPRCEAWAKRTQHRMRMMELAQAPQGRTLSGARSDT